jgi:uncharacterized membrane protein
MDAPLELIVSVYQGADRAARVLADLRQSLSAGDFEIKNAAVVVKDGQGRVHLRESDDVDAPRGALFGAITGALIGLIGGPGGAVAGALAGAATGGVAASVVDMGFTNDQLRDLQASMPADSSALVLLLEHTWVERLVTELEQHQGKLFRQEVAPDTLDQFRPSGGELGY